jgi:hypothetical protein
MHPELEDDYATTHACDVLNDWWDDAYGGVAALAERQ